MTSDKIAIVTGANNGIGFETTIGLAQAGFTTVMACRNGEKAEIARAKILERVPGADINVMLLDLSDLASVRTFASDFEERYEQNAGV